MADVIVLGEHKITLMHRNRYPKPECPHRNYELDDNGDIVTCTDCGKQVSAYFALREITTDWGRIKAQIATDKRRLDEEKDKHVHLLAAREVERAWRDRRHVPTCPHCGEGISPTDGFGRGAISKEIDAARRARRADERAKAAQKEGGA